MKLFQIILFVCLMMVSIAQSAKGRRMPRVTIAVIVPHSNFRSRNYTAAVTRTVENFKKHEYKFTSKYEIYKQVEMLQKMPSPKAILNVLCDVITKDNISTIFFLTNYETYGRETASAQYFLQLAGYLGIPVIAWNADNSALQRRGSWTSLQLQLAPSLEHQTAAMLSILERYKWHQFSVVTSQIAGHDDFIQAVREQIVRVQHKFKLNIINNVVVNNVSSDLRELASSETRIILLYSTQSEAQAILREANKLNITGVNYLWLVTQSVITTPTKVPPEFPIGMLGVHFSTDMDHLVNEISQATRVFGEGLEQLLTDPETNLALNPRLNCEGRGEPRWKNGDILHRYLRNVSIPTESGKPNLEFNQEGRLKSTELLIMNLRPKKTGGLIWEQIGVWKSWQKNSLDIKDIVWPGNSHTPPQGVPEKFHLKITFLEESPYIYLGLPDPVTGKCINKGVFCRYATEADMIGIDMETARKNDSLYKCCSGFCIDLLEKFANDIGFTYELFRVEDGKWGANTNGRWNGLVAALINHDADMVITSLKINYERAQAIDFSLPFADTGIAILVAKKTGIISPTAFLEPFDTAMWMIVALGAVHVAALTIFFFEWLSPYGYDTKMSAPPNHRFSLCRTLWLVWAVLFQAAVNIDCPRGLTARFMANVWAMFALIFLAIYTANLAAFMITREEFHELTGINDTKLSNPHSLKPPFKFGTVLSGNTEAVLRRNFPDMHAYANQFNRSNVMEGAQAVKDGTLDAFIYDATVLDHLVGQDSECVLLTVGSWFAMTGYAVGFPKYSKYRHLINRQLMEYRETGDLERLQRFWFTGACNKPVNKEKQSRSDPLALEQFFSTFLLLGSGILLAALMLFVEMIYCQYVKKVKWSEGGKLRILLRGCCNLLSRNMGSSLKQQRMKHDLPKLPPRTFMTPHNCRDSGCEANTIRLETALSAAQRRILELEVNLDMYESRVVPVCQVHGNRAREGRRGWSWRSGSCLLPVSSHTVHTQSSPDPILDYHPPQCDVIPVSHMVERCELWLPPVQMSHDHRKSYPCENREIETVL